MGQVITLSLIVVHSILLVIVADLLMRSRLILIFPIIIDTTIAIVSTASWLWMRWSYLAPIVLLETGCNLSLIGSS